MPTGKNKVMKRAFCALFTLVAISCTKVTQSDLVGDWCVDSIETQEVTSNTDSGWRSQTGVLSIFIVGETISFHRSYLAPCPSAESYLKAYDTYEGKVTYTISGGKLSIPEQVFTYYREDGDIILAGSMSIPSATFDATIDNGVLYLDGSHEDLDNLGNLKKRTNIRITLTK